MGVKKVDKIDKEKIEKYFTNINKSGNRLLNLINNLLDLSKLESQAVVLNLEEAKISEIITETINELDPLSKQKNVRFNMEYLTKNLTFECDKEKMFHVMMNLMSNAIKFSDERSAIDISFEDGTFVCDGKTIESLEISIKDSGVGIPQDEISKVFDKFYQSTKTRSKAGGTGLGLSICKEIISVHKGKIWAENNENKGSTFRVSIPRKFVG